MKRVIGRHGDPLARVQAVLDTLLADTPAPRVLEAGCGSTSRIALPRQRQLVGIDISERQLARHPSLDERVLGDLETTTWPANSFDLVVCWDVIEHLNRPDLAMTQLMASLRPGGGLLLAFPHFWSLKGLVTKLTPFGFHAWFYRHILGDRRERAALDQFPTPFRRDIAPQRVKQLAARAGLAVLYEEIYEGPVQTSMRERHRVFDWAFAALGGVSRTLSLGTIDLGLSDCILILRKPTAQARQPALAIGVDTPFAPALDATSP